MAVVSPPLTFNNSFWTQDYCTGLDVIFKKLEQARLFCARETVFFWLTAPSHVRRVSPKTMK